MSKGVLIDPTKLNEVMVCDYNISVFDSFVDVKLSILCDEIYTIYYNSENYKHPSSFNMLDKEQLTFGKIFVLRECGKDLTDKDIKEVIDSCYEVENINGERFIALEIEKRLTEFKSKPINDFIEFVYRRMRI